ncbi:hypothetical protein LWE61_12250 [Sphingobium sufflavum]|uniref:hypothetical protein n=1 Tax=Sphingobium sufflavum TaxID=1129547 RepID=UPI001F3F1259|nr:hypothetical protein [Sphingobium sufflavum]MCE7797326.1 hypothetical protein [Sphingobium sufflavum]
MDRRSEGAPRSLRDYPLSLRQSARAVFGDACDNDGRPADPLRGIANAGEGVKASIPPSRS